MFIFFIALISLNTLRGMEMLERERLKTFIEEHYLVPQQQYKTNKKGYCLIHNRYEERDTYRAHSHALFKHKRKSLYNCTQCDMTRFKNQEKFVEHLEQHPDLKWQCIACKHVFTTTDNIQRHINRTHDDLVSRGGSRVSRRLRKDFHSHFDEIVDIKQKSHIEYAALLLSAAKDMQLREGLALLTDIPSNN